MSIVRKLTALALLFAATEIQHGISNAQSDTHPTAITAPSGGSAKQIVGSTTAPVPPCCPPIPHAQQQTITDVIVLIDSTVSMGGYVSGTESRLSIAQWVALDVTDSVPEGIPAAFVGMFDEPSELRQLLPFTGDERAQLRRSVMNLRPRGDGKVDKLLNNAVRLLSDKPHSVPLIVLVTDGIDCDPSSHGDPIDTLKRQFGDRLYFQVIGICDSTSISGNLRSLATRAGANGDFASVKSYVELPSVMTRIRSLVEAVLK